MVKKPNRQEKAGMLIILGVIGFVAFSCSAITGSDEPDQPANPVQTEVAESGDAFDPEVGVELESDLPDCDAHGRVKYQMWKPGNGTKWFCMTDRDRDRKPDVVDYQPDLHDGEDADGDGYINSTDTAPHDPVEPRKSIEEFSSGSSDSGGYSSPFSCGPGDRDGDGDGKCNEG